MGELTMRSYTVLQSEEAFDLYAEAARRDRPSSSTSWATGRHARSGSDPTPSSMTRTTGGSWEDWRTEAR